MSQAAISDITHTMGDAMNAFSFWVGSSLFAINLEHVLSVEQDGSHIQPDPFAGRGSLGIVKHRGVPVRAFDFAEFLGVSSCGAIKQKTIDDLYAYEQEHVDWLTALEHALKSGEPFTRPREVEQCGFRNWCTSYESRDEELMAILKQFEAPHVRLHSLADKLLGAREPGELDRALCELDNERTTTLADLRRLFERAREQIRDSIKSVLLFVTTDGKEPRVALRLNEISDMVGFHPDQITATASLGITDSERLAGVFRGYLNTGAEKDCLLVDVEGLLATILKP